jgi:hypothetical protein
MLTMKVAIATAALSLVAFSASAATVAPADAMGQVGHTAKVCGVVASANYAADDPPPIWWTPMLGFRAGRKVSDEHNAPGISGGLQTRSG